VKRLIVALAALALCSIGQSQTTTVTASSLKLGGSSITTGTLTLTPVDINGHPIPFADATGAQNGPTAFACGITNGAITGLIQENGTASGTCAVPDSALTTPANVNYQAVITDISTGLRTSNQSYSYLVTGLTGSTFALDHYGPTANTTNLQAVQYQQGPTTPTSCLGPQIFINTTAPISASTCINGSFVVFASTSGSGSSYTLTLPAITALTGTGSNAVTRLGLGTAALSAASAFDAANAAAAVQAADLASSLQRSNNLSDVTTPATAATNITTFVKTQTGCSTAGYVWSPQAGACVPQTSSAVAATTSTAGGVILGPSATSNQLANVATSGSYNDLSSKPSGLASAGTPAAYVGGFTSNVNHAFLLTEGTGSLVTDAIGGATAAPVTGATVTWTSDYGLSFAGASNNRWQATGITTFQDVGACWITKAPISQKSANIAAAYGGTASSSFPEVTLGSLTTWNTSLNSAAGTSDFAGFHILPTTATDTGSTTPVSAGRLHCLELSMTPAATVQEYVDGVLVTNSAVAVTAPAALSGGYLEFGGSILGYVNCLSTSCGFNGTLYEVWTGSTGSTAQQAWQNWANSKKVLQAKGVNIDQAIYTNAGNGAQNTAALPVQIIGFGESVTWGHGLTTPTTQNYSVIAATAVNGGSAFGKGHGADSNTAYIMHGNLANLTAEFSPVASNVAVLFSNANDCKQSSGTVTGYTYAANVPNAAASGLIADAKSLQALGWTVLVATGTSGAYGSADVGKDACNPVLRQRAIQAGIPLWDIASDPRFGADGADTASGGATACSSGACYQGDHIHPTIAAQAIMGANLAVAVNHILYSAPASTTAATYAMTGMEAPLSTNPSTASQTITLPDCIGLTGQSFSIVNAQATGSNTVTLSPVSTITTELINGKATYLVPNASTVTVTAYNLGDTTAGCGWLAVQ
jgi:hypothetical protein